jgi:hypothetical protein
MTHLRLHQNTKLGVFGTGCRPGDEAKRAFDAMMEMKKIDIAAIEAAWRG